MDFVNHYYGNILDPIHGQIKLSEIEKWVLSQKIFSRLRYVKQNTFLYYIFPSANHTRFEHSIGVMHLASKVFEACLENYATGHVKRTRFSSNTQSDFFDFTKSIDRPTRKVIYQELRLAALLHDVGHGPMAHMFDSYSITQKSFKEILSKDPDTGKYVKLFEPILGIKKRVPHEALSCFFVIKLLFKLKKESAQFSTETRTLISKIEPYRVAKIIENKLDIFKVIEFKGKEKGNYDLTPFLSNIISGFPVDADRMDYLLRDCHFSGVKYGVYDLSRVFSSFIPVIQNKKVYLCIKESGLDSIIRFIQSRTHLFNQVYYHKTNRAANRMLEQVGKERINFNAEVVGASSFLELEDFYWNNSDEYFLRNQLPLILNNEGHKLLKEIQERTLFKRIFKKRYRLYRRHDESFKKFEKRVKRIRKQLSQIKDAIESELSSSQIFVDIAVNENFKDIQKSEIRIAKKRLDGQYDISDNWNLNNDFISMHSVLMFFRVYLRNNLLTPKLFERSNKLLKNELKPFIDLLENVSEN